MIAVPRNQGFKETSPGHQYPVITTKVWYVKVIWRDKSANWIPISEIKESNPIEVFEDAISVKHDREP